MKETQPFKMQRHACVDALLDQQVKNTDHPKFGGWGRSSGEWPSVGATADALRVLDLANSLNSEVAGMAFQFLNRDTKSWFSAEQPDGNLTVHLVSSAIRAFSCLATGGQSKSWSKVPRELRSEAKVRHQAALDWLVDAQDKSDSGGWGEFKGASPTLFSTYHAVWALDRLPVKGTFAEEKRLGRQFIVDEGVDVGSAFAWHDGEGSLSPGATALAVMSLSHGNDLRHHEYAWRGVEFLVDQTETWSARNEDPWEKLMWYDHGWFPRFAICPLACVRGLTSAGKLLGFDGAVPLDALTETATIEALAERRPEAISTAIEFANVLSRAVFDIDSKMFTEKGGWDEKQKPFVGASRAVLSLEQAIRRVDGGWDSLSYTGRIEPGLRPGEKGMTRAKWDGTKLTVSEINGTLINPGEGRIRVSEKRRPIVNAFAELGEGETLALRDLESAYGPGDARHAAGELRRRSAQVLGRSRPQIASSSDPFYLCTDEMYWSPWHFTLPDDMSAEVSAD